MSYTHDDIAQLAIVDRMIADIKKIGLREYWNMIERNFHQPKVRASYRKFFLITEKKLKE